MMTQAERDRLVALKKVQSKRMTQAAAAEELGVSERQVQRLLKELNKRGDGAVIHGLKGQASNRRLDEKARRKALQVLSRDEYRDFGPTLASEYLGKLHGVEASRETTRKWMTEAGLWKAKREKVGKVHTWRARRSRSGELVQWDTSNHDWLEGRSREPIYLISMIDDATSRLWARFVRSDSTEENMRVLWKYLEMNGRPLAFYTDKASVFQTTQKRRREEPGVDKDPVEMPPTQIGRALRELSIAWIAAHSAQAKGRVERSHETAQDRLVKGLRIAGVKTLEGANRYLDEEYLPWWRASLAVVPASGEEAHRPLDSATDLGAILSHVETRQVRGNDHTIQWYGTRYRVEAASICTGLRHATVRVEQRLDGTVAVRFRDRYLQVTLCEEAQKVPAAAAHPEVRVKKNKGRRDHNRGGKSQWMKSYYDRQGKGPTLDQAIKISNATG